MKISALGSRTKWAIVGAAVSVVAVLLITSYLYFFARFIGLEEEQSLADNDGHGFFGALGDSVITGPTLTNVNDFRAILVTESERK